MSSYVHEFVDAMPENLEPGRLYVSVRYRTAAHLCACGCGTKVITPIKPAKWHLIFDGDTVSLWPSIGRWQLPCRSHYWLDNGRVRWSEPWTDEQIEQGRARDAQSLRRYYASRQAIADTNPPATKPSQTGPPRRWQRFMTLLRR